MSGAGSSPRTAIGVGLMLMSCGAGCMDILSYRFLGDVFTSAMTGNVALMGLSLGQGDLAAAVRNMSAFAGFIAGLTVGAMLMRRAVERRTLLQALVLQALLLAGFAVLWRLRSEGAARYGLIGLSAVGMGLQSAVAHRLGVRGVSTTYFTGTLSNIVFGLVEPRPAQAGAGVQTQPKLRRVGWPVLAFLAYLTGAAIAGWYTAGMRLTDLPFGLPALPCAATVILIAIIALAGPQRA